MSSSTKEIPAEFPRAHSSPSSRYSRNYALGAMGDEMRSLKKLKVPGSHPARDVSHKPGGKLPLLSARPAVTPATLKRAAINFAAW